MSARGPWYITVKACEDYLSLLNRPATDDNLEAAEEALIEMAVATEGKQPTGVSDSGALRYRGPSPHRLTLIVSTERRREGDLPQLIGVTCDPRRKRAIREEEAKRQGLTPEKRGPGRPAGTRTVSEPGQAYGGEPITVRLPPDMAATVRERGAQAYIKRLLDMPERLREAIRWVEENDRDNAYSDAPGGYGRGLQDGLKMALDFCENRLTD